MATKASRVYNSAKNLNLDGYKRQIYIERLMFGTPGRTHQENKYGLWKWYSGLKNWIPTQDIELSKEDSALLEEIFEDYKIVHKKYMASFEGAGDCSPLEKEFEWAMNIVFFKLDTITAKVRALDGIEEDKERGLSFVNPSTY